MCGLLLNEAMLPLFFEFRLVYFNRFHHSFHRFLFSVDSSYFNGRRLSFELFVGFHEVLIFLKRVLVYIRKILHVFPSLVFDGYRDNFKIRFAAVHHIDNGDRAHIDENPCLQGIGCKHDHIERVAVFPECLWSKSVVVWKCCGGIIRTVELDKSGCFIDFVLIVGAFWNFDNDIKFFRRIIAERYIVPKIHIQESVTDDGYRALLTLRGKTGKVRAGQQFKQKGAPLWRGSFSSEAAQSVRNSNVSIDTNPSRTSPWDIIDALRGVTPQADGVMLSIPNGDTGFAELSYLEAFREKHLVTCAKGAHAYRYREVMSIGRKIGRRATVGGGTDMLEVLRRRYLQDEDVTIHAVVNGTLNYIWSVIQGGGSFAEAVSDAKDLGFAEPGATNLVDIINGELLDVAMKCAILKNVALPCTGSPMSADAFDIVKLTDHDIKRLTSRNARYRFITTLSSVDDVDEIEKGAPGSIWGRCGRRRITGGFHNIASETPWYDWLREVGGVKNGFVIHNALGKDTGNSLTGPGAGPEVTAKAMVRDFEEQFAA